MVRSRDIHSFKAITDCIIEELSTISIPADSYYLDPHINKLSRDEEKLTVHLIDSDESLHCHTLQIWIKRIRNKNLYIFNDKTLLRNSIKIASNSIFSDKVIRIY